MTEQEEQNKTGVVYLPRELRRKYQAQVDAACKLDAGDGVIITKALGDIAREIGVIHVTTLAGLERTSFYRMFNGKTAPRISSIAKLTRALGVKVEMH